MRGATLRKIENQLGGRPVYYYGSRGQDGEPLAALSTFAGECSLTAPLLGSSTACLETISSSRVDTDVFDIDAAHDDASRTLRAKLAGILDENAFVVPFRPNHFLESTCLCSRHNVSILSNPAVTQRAFEYKPWVEQEITKLGLRTIPWTYLHASSLRDYITSNPELDLVIRGSRSESGNNVWFVPKGDSYSANPNDRLSSLYCVSPLLVPSMPLAVNACVFPDGFVSLDGLSVQILGIPQLTSHYFGYCGNDFSAARDLSKDIVFEIERMVQVIGKWLRRYQYLGTFGVDLLLHNQLIFFVELNPRFQGASFLAELMNEKLDRPGPYLNHLSAHLQLAHTCAMPLFELVQRQCALTHVLQRNTNKVAVHFLPDGIRQSRVRRRFTPDASIQIQPGAIMQQLIYEERLLTPEGDLTTKLSSELMQVLTEKYIGS